MTAILYPVERKCPACRASVSENARICRACYTVLPREEQVKKTKVGWPAIALRCFIILFFVAGAAWIYRIDVTATSSKYETPNQNVVGQLYNVVSGASASRLSLAGQSPRNAVAVEENTVAVMARGNRCIVRQKVHNSGRRAVSHVSLNIAFSDAHGNLVGKEQAASSKTNIAAGKSAVVDFELACPRSVVSARVRVPPPTAGNALTDQETVSLLTSHGEAANQLNDQNSSYIIVVELPDLTVCPPPEACELPVYIDDVNAVEFTFQRSRDNPTLLMSTNSILVAHLQKNDAMLRAPSTDGELASALSATDLVEVENRQSIFNWLTQLLPGR